MAASKRVTGEAIWLDGEFVDWDAARVHVLTHTLHYGLGVFEGIRCYRTVDGRSAVFRLDDHVRRKAGNRRTPELQDAEENHLWRPGYAETACEARG